MMDVDVCVWGIWEVWIWAFGLFLWKISTMTYIVELRSETALALLQNLAALNVLTLRPQNGTAAGPGKTKKTAPNTSRQRTQDQNMAVLKPAKKASVPLRQKSLAGSISPETAEKMLLHVEKLRNEWERI